MLKPALVFPFLLSFVSLAACDRTPAEPTDNVERCSGYCVGLDLVIDSIRTTPPAGQSAVFSRDTFDVTLFVRNRGSVVADTFTAVYAQGRSGAFGSVSLPVIPPNKTLAVHVPVVMPLFEREGVTADSLRVELFRAGADVPHGYEFLAEKYSKPFPVSPTTFTLSGVPAVLRYPGAYTLHVIVNNPSARAVASDTVSTCVFDIDYCIISAAAVFVMPNVPAHSTLTFDVPVELQRIAASASLFDAWQAVDFRACYDDRGPSITCRFISVDLLPDYEAFCSVLRLPPATTVNATTVGSCGVGFNANRLDIASIDLRAGEVAQFAAPGVSVQVYTASGERIETVTTGQLARSFLAPSSGRYYLLVTGNGAYTISWNYGA